ncbi:MAG: hypothetical protein K2X69_01690 [Silvanigrellaceae bacterium]|nr:hypothetical protein [Silvanigrellaceae bacterium]
MWKIIGKISERSSLCENKSGCDFGLLTTSGSRELDINPENFNPYNLDLNNEDEHFILQDERDISKILAKP